MKTSVLLCKTQTVRGVNSKGSTVGQKTTNTGHLRLKLQEQADKERKH